ncbi:ABC transporter ATP-binding protein [Allobranchiibius sp. GilTou38]|uniref:ABC transporter ATP-binding protein n=1 Tax=Allobranchiibius sp. GilTou38 TaxID=2815210 RepID=UPI001AA1B52E|nr:ABC transporter ATP-binding protein [Allobranchiibius sp. GilTou38]MBO1766272.1 ABC transporter ATP-binding protein [Allobranchiibius sp. GilTou38]
MSIVTKERPDTRTRSLGDTESMGTWAILRRGLALSPELGRGFSITLALALVATLGQVLVPIAVQQTTDKGILAAGGPDVGLVLRLVLVVAGAVVLTSVASYAVNLRLFRSSESGLATLRIKGFRQIHDLSMLTQNAERRGSLVSRVTSDVDQISKFVQSSGLTLIISGAQILIATALMLFYSPELTGVVWICFVPLFLLLRKFQARIGRAYLAVRERVGDMLGAISESVVGATTIRAYGVEDRTAERIDVAVEAHRRAAITAQIRTVSAFVSGQVVAGATTIAALGVGTILAAHGRLTIGELVAFLFLVNLFTQPVQTATENLNELQNAVAGWRRVIGLIDTPADVPDPGEGGVDLPRGPVRVQLQHVGFAYPGGPTVLHDIDLDITPGSRVAIVGETGSGKTTIGKLLTRLMDPVSGAVLLNGVDVRRIRFSSLRSRVVLVPQEGFLFDASLLENVRFARPGVTQEEVLLAFATLGLGDWLDGLPSGLATAVGQRGESLSAGERQLVALVRAYLTEPDLLLLDEATSAVDPATEVRIQRALERLASGRTSIAIAHRLSTAEAADEVVVVDRGRIVQRGPHDELVAQTGSVYARMHASWSAQSG